MCSAHKHHIVCMVWLCATGCCVLVQFVVGGFGWVGLLWPCWEDLVVDHLPAVDCCLGYRLDYLWPTLVSY